MLIYGEGLTRTLLDESNRRLYGVRVAARPVARRSTRADLLRVLIYGEGLARTLLDESNRRLYGVRVTAGPVAR